MPSNSNLKRITQEIQGKYCYTIGPYNEPRLTVRPGETVVVETEDAFEGKIKTEADRPSQVLEMPYVNPLVGPIYMEGAEKGDTLAVRIEEIVPRGEGTTCLIPYFGGLTNTDRTATLNEPLPEIVKKVRIEDGWVHWNDRIKIPYEPFIGSIGTAPEIEAISSLTPERHGGNMDLPDIKPEATLYLPVMADGALLHLGDVHACQGDGELCGVAIEHRSETTITLELIKGKSITWPRLESPEFIMAIGSARPMEDAARIAYTELVGWLEADYGFERWDAYMLLTQVGRVRLANMVDPLYTIGAAIPKRYLPES
ncbi:MAG: acetamidase/formamidase family protein [Candidatus Bipolaricaulia bacterium]